MLHPSIDVYKRSPATLCVHYSGRIFIWISICAQIKSNFFLSIKAFYTKVIVVIDICTIIAKHDTYFWS